MLDHICWFVSFFIVSSINVLTDACNALRTHYLHWDTGVPLKFNGMEQASAIHHAAMCSSLVNKAASLVSTKLSHGDVCYLVYSYESCFLIT